MRKIFKNYFNIFRRESKRPAPVVQVPIPIKENLILNIINEDGLTAKFECFLNNTWSDVKLRAIREFYGKSTNKSLVRLAKKNVLLSVISRVAMEDGKTLCSTETKDNEEFLLKETVQHHSNEPEYDTAGPSIQLINAITNNYTSVKSVYSDDDSSNVIPVINSEDYVMDNIDTELREVITACARLSAYVVGLSPYADRLIAFAKQRIINQKRNESDMVKRLVDMGFSRLHVKHSLKLNNNVYPRALDWLIQNQSTLSANTERGSSSSSIDLSEANNCDGTFNPNANIPNSNLTTLNNVRELLHIVDIYSRIQEPPDDLVKNIIEMGFGKRDVLKALNLTRNCASSACIWLCGDRTDSLTNLQNIVSPVMVNLLTSADFNRCLADPYIFMTYLSILENTMEPYASLIDEYVSEHFGRILNVYLVNKRYKIINEYNS